MRETREEQTRKTAEIMMQKTDPEPQEMMKPEKRKAMGKMSGEMVEITKQKTCR